MRRTARLWILFGALAAVSAACGQFLDTSGTDGPAPSSSASSSTSSSSSSSSGSSGPSSASSSSSSSGVDSINVCTDAGFQPGSGVALVGFNYFAIVDQTGEEPAVIVGESGIPCKTAAACIQKLAAGHSSAGWALPPADGPLASDRHRYAATTSGTNVTFYDTVADMEKAIVPIDTASEAALVAVAGGERRVVCPSVVTEDEKGWSIVVQRGKNCKDDELITERLVIGPDAGIVSADELRREGSVKCSK